MQFAPVLRSTSLAISLQTATEFQRSVQNKLSVLSVMLRWSLSWQISQLGLAKHFLLHLADKFWHSGLRLLCPHIFFILFIYSNQITFFCHLAWDRMSHECFFFSFFFFSTTASQKADCLILRPSPVEAFLISARILGLPAYLGLCCHVICLSKIKKSKYNLATSADAWLLVEKQEGVFQPPKCVFFCRYFPFFLPLACIIPIDKRIQRKHGLQSFVLMHANRPMRAKLPQPHISLSCRSFFCPTRSASDMCREATCVEKKRNVTGGTLLFALSVCQPAVIRTAHMKAAADKTEEWRAGGRRREGGGKK